MKKEIIAAVLLLLLFAGVLVNIRINEIIVSSLMHEVDLSYESLKTATGTKPPGSLTMPLSTGSSSTDTRTSSSATVR